MIEDMETRLCQSCDPMVINGIVVHEKGCPDRYMDEIRICKWCGQEYAPNDLIDDFCSTECGEDYYGIE